jgi:hypothetical protein
MFIQEVLPMFRRNLLLPLAIHKVKFIENVVRDRERAGPVLGICESLWDM